MSQIHLTDSALIRSSRSGRNWGERLKKQREKMGLTQEDIAKVLNRTRNHVHNMETQKHPPKAHELAIFADTIGLDMSLIFNQNYSFSARLLQIAQLDKNMTLGDLEKATGIDYINSVKQKTVK